MIEKIKDLVEIAVGLLTATTLIKSLLAKPKAKSNRKRRR